MTTEQREEFIKLAKPIIKWLNENGNPHMEVIISTKSAEVLSGEIAFECNDYIKD